MKKMPDTPKTLADYFEATKVDVSSAPDYAAGRRLRLKSLIVDGRPLGDYELDAVSGKESAKRFTELQWLAISLIGCDTDREVRAVTSLAPRSVPTADFEATTASGSLVRVDEREKRLLNAVTGIHSEVQARLDRGIPGVTGGEFSARLYPGADPTWGDVASAAAEFASFMQDIVRRRDPSVTLWPADSEYSTLKKLGACLAYLSADKPPRFFLRPALVTSNHQATLQIFERLVTKKKAKFADYSEGYPVWLSIAVESVITPFQALGFVQFLQGLDSFDPAPFERVLVGCFTAGVTFTKSRRRPRYTSLDTTG
jgi:hypothetical protein